MSKKSCKRCTKIMNELPATPFLSIFSQHITENDMIEIEALAVYYLCKDRTNNLNIQQKSLLISNINGCSR